MVLMSGDVGVRAIDSLDTIGRLPPNNLLIKTPDAWGTLLRLDASLGCGYAKHGSESFSRSAFLEVDLY